MVAVGDEVTVVAEPNVLRPLLVTHMNKAREHVQTSYGLVLAFAHEGVWWIRGHHTNDSPEGAALLAANALVLG